MKVTPGMVAKNATISSLSFQVQIYRHTYNSMNEYMIYSQEAENASGREQFHSVPALENMDINATQECPD